MPQVQYLPESCRALTFSPDSIESSGSTFEFAAQPGLGEAEIVADDVDGFVEHGSRFLGAHAAEVAHFDEAGQVFIFGCQGVEGAVEIEDLHLRSSGMTFKIDAGGPGNGGHDVLVTRAFLGGAGAGIIDQDLAHDAGGDR